MRMFQPAPGMKKVVVAARNWNNSDISVPWLALKSAKGCRVVPTRTPASTGDVARPNKTWRYDGSASRMGGVQVPTLGGQRPVICGRGGKVRGAAFAPPRV